MHPAEQVQLISRRGFQGSALRILQVLGQKPGGTGSGVVVRHLLEEAQLAGDEARLVCAGYPGEDFSEHILVAHRVVRFSSGQAFGQIPFPIAGMSDVMPYETVRYSDLSPQQAELILRAYRAAVADEVVRFRPDLLHVHHAWILVNLAATFESLPTVVTVHGTDLQQWSLAPQHRFLVLTGLERVRHWLSVGEDVASEIQEKYGVPAHKVSVIGNGFQLAVFNWRGDSQDVAGPIVLCAGKFVGWKGFQYAIQACDGLEPPTKLVILGAGSNDSRDALLAEAARCGMDARVHLPGHVSEWEVARWMRRADVFVLPSIREPFGLVLLEALACGCRVVAADAGGVKDIVSRELVASGMAVVVRRLDVESRHDEARYVSDLRVAIARQLSQPPTEADRATIAATVRHWTWRAVYTRVREVYRLNGGPIA